MRAADFLDTLGVNTHVNSAPYDDTARIVAALNYIGFDNIRQSSPIDQGSLDGITALGAAGERIDLIINGGGPVDLSGAMQNVYRLAPYLNAVENVNEAAIYPIRYAGLGGVDAAVALQKDLYAAVRADPALNNVPVYSFTIGGADPSAYPSIGDISNDTDYVNIHAYPPDGLRPIFVIHAAIAGGRTDAPSKPVVLTETGFYTLTDGVGWGGVPESVQASYLLDEVLDEAVAGVARTYLYDLLDDGPDPAGTNQEAHFGLFHDDGSPKPAATAFHNLTAILADSGSSASSFPISDFAFTASGVPYDYTGNTLVLDKSDGSHVIAVWNEEQLWDTDKLVPIAAQHIPVTVDLHQSYQLVLVFDPTVSAAPVQTLHNVENVHLDLTDHPFLIQVFPDAASTPPATPVTSPPVTTPVVPPSVPPPAVTPPAAATNAVIVVHVSEDAYLGDAAFQLTVNGVPTGAVQTATASHGAGLAQDVTLVGPADAIPGSLDVAFLNDAWGGTAATDRNLYVDGVTVNGVDQRNSARTLYSNGGTEIALGQKQSTQVTFNLSEDAWQGDAQAVVAIDGQQLGDPVTVTALHVLGAVQQLSFVVPLDAGAHTATVSFLNDAYGGSPQTDRNLYVESITAGSTPVPNATEILTNTGSKDFTMPSRGSSSDPFSVSVGPTYLIASST